MIRSVEVILNLDFFVNINKNLGLAILLAFLAPLPIVAQEDSKQEELLEEESTQEEVTQEILCVREEAVEETSEQGEGEFSGQGESEELVECKDFDFNKNFKLDPGAEQDAYLRHFHSAYYREVDTNKDGQIDEAERIAYESKLDDLVAENADELNSIREERGMLSFEEADEITKGPPEPKPSKNLFGFQIRRHYEDISVVTPPKEFAAIQPAILSFASDFINNNDTWAARGAIFYPIRVETSEDTGTTSGNPVLSAYTLNPGITFDRVDNSNSDDKDVNVLNFKFGSELEITGGPLFNANYFRFSANYETDFDFKPDVLAFEAQWEPILLGAGIGVSRSIFGGAIEYRLRGILHTEIGSVVDSGGRDDLNTGETIFRIGPKIQLQFWPGGEAIQRFAFNINWEFLQTLTGDTETRDLFEAGLTFRLDNVGHASLDLTYRSGEVALTNQKTDIFNLGFGLKF